MEKQIKKYYENIDISRFFAAFLIVAIHTSFLKNVSARAHFFVMTICGLAVPLFFACSGFFLFSKFSYIDGKIEKSPKNMKMMLAYEKRLIIAYVFWSAVYFAAELLAALRSGGELKSFLLHFMKDFFMNGSEYHLWYVTCLIYAVPILYLLLRHMAVKHLLWFVPVLFVIGQTVEGYYWLDLPFMQTALLVKEAVGGLFQVPFRAMTFAGVGIYFSQIKIKAPKAVLALLFAAFFTASVSETFVISEYFAPDINVRYSMFLIAVIFCLFALLVKGAKDEPKHKKATTFLRKTSSFIYFVHPAVLIGLNFVWGSLQETAFLYFFLACVLSFFAASIVVLLSKKIKLLEYIY